MKIWDVASGRELKTFISPQLSKQSDALVEEGLKATAADNQPKDGQVVLREWLDFATERVPQMQETKMRTAHGLNVAIAFVEGEEKVGDVDKRTLQRPRVFYRREQEGQPLVVAKP